MIIRKKRKWVVKWPDKLFFLIYLKKEKLLVKRPDEWMNEWMNRLKRKKSVKIGSNKKSKN